MKNTEHSKETKVFRAINIALSFLMSFACVVLSFYYGLVNNWNNRLFSAILMSVVSLFPIFFELIVRRRLSNFLFLGINLYILFAGVLGAAANFYYLISWYDIIIHTIMGYAIAMLAYFFLCRLGENRKMKVITIALFCLFFSLGVELIWEIFERFADVFLGQTAQGPKIPGTNSPLVADTIEDLICNLSGAVAFFVHFIIDKFTKLKLGFAFIERDFSADLRFNGKQKLSHKTTENNQKNIEKSQEEKNITEK